jgi:hypothetical protein
MDDIAVMPKKKDDLIVDLQETFNNLRRYNMMLNPMKCIFGVPAGQLLGLSSPTVELKSTRRKSRPSLTYPGPTI